MSTHKAVFTVLLSLLVLCALISCDKNPLNDDDNLVFGTLKDIDGNVYKTVIIGNQEWMTENLRVTKYNDGTSIPHVTDSSQWSNITTPGYCFYNNSTDVSYRNKWGALYNWYVVSPSNPKQIAPVGWRVPTDADWDTLQNYLITNGYNWDGSTSDNRIAKSMASKTDWISSTNAGAIGNDLSKNNASGFSALPSGNHNYNGSFYAQTLFGYWWCAKEFDASYAYSRHLYYLNEDLKIYFNRKRFGFSVRLVRSDRELPLETKTNFANTNTTQKSCHFEKPVCKG